MGVEKERAFPVLCNHTETPCSADSRRLVEALIRRDGGLVSWPDDCAVAALRVGGAAVFPPGRISR